MKNKTFAGLIGALIILVAGYFILGGSFDFNITKDVKDKTKSKATSTTYINEDGEEFEVPHGKYEFQVSSANDGGPVFLEGEINPPDVHLGDIQEFKVVVRSDAGIDSVLANIETDNGIKTINLEKTGTIDSSDLSVPRLKVNDENMVKVLSEKERQQIAESMKEGYMPTAYAQEGENEVWEGEWKVHDVHDTTYITQFVAIDNNGSEETLTLAWSDKCGIPINGNWSSSSNCYHYDGVDGVAGISADATLNSGDTLTLGDGDSNEARFVVQGGSLNLNGGNISLSSDAVLDFNSSIYIDNYDGDGYPESGYSQYTSNASDRSSRAGMSGWETDCNDWTSDVYPNNLSWYTEQISYCQIDVCYFDQGWDYNCSGSNEKRWTYVSDCTQIQKYEESKVASTIDKVLSFFNIKPKAFAQERIFGWSGSIPGCGQNNLWHTGYDSCSNTEYRAQECH